MALFLMRDFEKQIDLDVEEPVYETMGVRRDLLSNTSIVCKFFNKGGCERDVCPYRHAYGEKSVVCKHWWRGLCKKMDLCEYLHEYDLNRMPQCQFFSAEGGSCNRPECPFLHVTEEDKVKDCPWFDRGFCKHGPNCRNRHMLRQACPEFLAGFCPKGPNCAFQHPRFEIPTLADMKGTGKRIEINHNIVCSKCNVVGHSEQDCTVLPEESRKLLKLRPLKKVMCFKCGDMGHYANMCPNPKKDPPPGGWRMPGDDNPNGGFNNRLKRGRDN